MQVIGNLLPETRLASASCLDQCFLLRVNGITFREVMEDVEAQRAVAKKVGLLGCLMSPFRMHIFYKAHATPVRRQGLCSKELPWIYPLVFTQGAGFKVATMAFPPCGHISPPRSRFRHHFVASDM